MNPSEIDYHDFVRNLAKSGTLIATDLNNDANLRTTHLLYFVTRLATTAGKLLDDCLGYVQREDNYTPESAHIIHMGIGIFGEVGELVDAIKKAAIYNKPLDLGNVMEELGDVEFYAEGLSQAAHGFSNLYHLYTKLSTIYTLLHTTQQLVREGNISKLYKRYEGAVYSDQAAQDRADKVE